MSSSYVFPAYCNKYKCLTYFTGAPKSSWPDDVDEFEQNETQYLINMPPLELQAISLADSVKEVISLPSVHTMILFATLKTPVCFSLTSVAALAY